MNITLSVEKGIAMAHSELIAKILQTRHEEILKTIDHLREDEFNRKHFIKVVDMIDLDRNITAKHFLVDKDGFELLSLYFPGKEKMEAVSRLIHEYNLKTSKPNIQNRELTIFSNPHFGEIRVQQSESGEPLFCALDVAKSLLYSNPAKAVIDHCKGVTILETPTNGGVQSMKFISEFDMYRLILKSKAPKAEKFQDWVCEEVLPSIRKHGIYAQEIAIERMLNNPEFAIKALQNLKEEREARKLAQLQLEAAKKKIEEDAPKLDYYHKITDSVSTFVPTDIAKSFGHSARWMNTKLKNCGLIYRLSNNWYVKSPYDRCGLHKVMTYPYPRKDGTTGTRHQLEWTEKGKEFIEALVDTAFNMASACNIMRQKYGKPRGGARV